MVDHEGNGLRVQPAPGIDAVSDTAELPTVVIGPAGPTEQTLAAARLAAAVELARSGQRAAARGILAGLWAESGPVWHTALARCLIAHHLAGLVDDLGEELAWHRRALQAGQLAGDEAAAWGLPIPAQGLFALLHLRLADCHARRGEPARARDHLQQARAWAPALPADAYGERVRAGLRHLGDHLDLLTPPSGRHRVAPAPPPAEAAHQRAPSRRREPQHSEPGGCPGARHRYRGVYLVSGPG